VKTPLLGEATTHLSWLCPSKASLLALARETAGQAWTQVRQDPAAVLLVLRTAARFLSSASVSNFPAVLREPCILEGALDHLGRSTAVPGQTQVGFVDWTRPDVFPILHSALACAWTAQQLAQRTGLSDAENAWAAGLLAPVGWFAAAALSLDAAKRCLTDPLLLQDPYAAQQKHWGIDHSALARRLLRRWRLPSWLSRVIEHLGLEAETACALGADPALLRIVQTAIALVQQNGRGLHLTCGTNLNENIIALELSARELDSLSADLATVISSSPVAEEWQSPHGVPLLDDVLRQAAENRRLRAASVLDQLEREHDQLHRALQYQRRGENERLHVLKLQALAEFAAGAAHEINNPLAVISGEAQYLLGRESDPENQKALQTVINQTHRVDHVLLELMQFARPSRPHIQHLDLPALMREVTLALTDLALKKQVKLICPDPEQGLRAAGDAHQLQTALECLLRNAIEAAPEGGWASIRVQRAGADRLEWIIEDSGVGPSPNQREHMFDPFYSGRHAGRGRGLGLPTAWRLAREHGGDVRLDPTSGGPTRFILSLPTEPVVLEQTKNLPSSDGADAFLPRAHDPAKRLNGHTLPRYSEI
jgi:two-component system, NtrC family, sensor kinase